MILIVIYLICWKCGNFGLTLLPIKQKTVTGGGFAPVYGTREIHHRRHIISAAVIGQGIPSIGAKKTMLLYCWQVRSSDLLSEKKKKTKYNEILYALELLSPTHSKNENSRNCRQHNHRPAYPRNIRATTTTAIAPAPMPATQANRTQLTSRGFLYASALLRFAAFGG